ncbi:aspartate--tRNA ligase [Candidatus Woesearchaeota archaeon]|nr:aspartate--tRNA ligase [Candidatus Woesearchaeota archaeon]
MYRTHTCGELRKDDAGKNVTLAGWLQSKRLHGGLIFLDIRDRYGITQAVLDPHHHKASYDLAPQLKHESVIQVKGIVRLRKEGMAYEKLETGSIEVLADGLTILSSADVLPLEVKDEINATEDQRLKYRYLDLRRKPLQNNILLRHKVVKFARDYLDNRHFIEIETPILSKSTPEGARDYLVPSRVHPGQFFALPQSPQQYKQLLMVAGFDRYFQVVRCFRDEDLRADRQPEFTQIDMEMSFIEQEDIFAVCEGMVRGIFKHAVGQDITPTIPRMTYKEAMDRFGTDRPDTRFGLELIDVSDIFANTSFNVFKNASIKAIRVTGDFSRKDYDELTAFVKVYEAKGLVWLKKTDMLEGSVVKFFSEQEQVQLIKRTGILKGENLFMVADHDPKIVYAAQGNLRLELGRRLGLIDESKHNFLWVIDFPLLDYDKEEKRYVAVHHPFTSPKKEDIALLEKSPLSVRANAYDLVLNGTEIAGGSIRIHDAALQQQMFSLLGIEKEEAYKKFGMLLEAFTFGAPPHGGIAFGLDRLVAILAKTPSIREVIAFPKNKSCNALMEGAPSSVDEKQIDELRIKMI